MRNATRLLITVALAAGGASMAVAQRGPAAPLPGSGNSTAISDANRDANAAYNHVMGSGDLQTKQQDTRSRRQSGPVPATAADIKVGAALRDIKGVPIGTIAGFQDDQAIVDTGATKIGVPLIGFGKDQSGLLLNMTADRFHQLVAQAHARSQAQPSASN